MDLVSVVAACAIGLRSELFVPLGMHGDCDRAAAIDTEPMRAQPAGPIERWANEITAASLRFGMPKGLLRAVMRAESGGTPNITSSAGAMGLMQLMPETWATMRVRYRLGSDPYTPADNIMAGAAFLRELIDRYGAPDFLAAYNAGPARLEDHHLRGRPLPDETRRYVAQLAPVVQDVTAPTTLKAPAALDNDNLQQSMAPPRNDAASGAAPMSGTDRGLFAMDQNAGARGRVLTDQPASSTAATNPLPRARPNARDGDAIFPPIGAPASVGSASRITFPAE